LGGNSSSIRLDQSHAQVIRICKRISISIANSKRISISIPTTDG
jgi:hypothetical protein